MGESPTKPPQLPSLEEEIAARAAQLAGRLPGGRGNAAAEERVRMTLSLELLPAEGWRVVADPPLAAQLEAAVREAAALRHPLRQGRVWCHRCESNDCPHARPPEPGTVFTGYSPTGQPLWEQLPQFLLTIAHPGLDLLFQPQRADLLAAFIGPERLTERQLPAFGKDSPAYRLLGAVVLGHLRVGLHGGETERVAATLLAVSTREGRRRPEIDLNVIARFPGGAEGIAAAEGLLGERLFDRVSAARRKLGSLASHGRPAGPARDETLDERAAAILRQTARGIERLRRQGERRTIHAQARGPVRRETSPALADVREAPAGSLLSDERRGTVVVLGPRHRVHVFTPDGRHVTTLAMEGDEVARRVSRGRWTPLASLEEQRFRETVEGRGG